MDDLGMDNNKIRDDIHGNYYTRRMMTIWTIFGTKIKMQDQIDYDLMDEDGAVEMIYPKNNTRID